MFKNVLRLARLLRSEPVPPLPGSPSRFGLADQFFPRRKSRPEEQIREAKLRFLVVIPQPIRPYGAIFAFQHHQRDGGLAEDAFGNGTKNSGGLYTIKRLGNLTDRDEIPLRRPKQEAAFGTQDVKLNSHPAFEPFPSSRNSRRKSPRPPPRKRGARAHILRANTRRYTARGETLGPASASQLQSGRALGKLHTAVLYPANSGIGRLCLG
jgi:hypothetical protein